MLTPLSPLTKAVLLGSNTELSLNTIGQYSLENSEDERGTNIVIPPGLMSGPTPVRSTSLCIRPAVRVFGFDLLPVNDGK